VSTQNQPIRYFSVHCILAGLLSTHVCKFLREVVGAKLRNVCYMAMPFNGRFRVLACLTYTTLLLYAPLKIFCAYDVCYAVCQCTMCLSVTLATCRLQSLLIRNCIQQMMLFCNLFFHAGCVVFKVLLRQLREGYATKKHGGD